MNTVRPMAELLEAVTRSLVAAKADGCEVLTPPCRPAMTRSNTLIVREEGQSGQDYCQLLAECSVPASVDLELRSDPDDDTVSTTTEDEEALDGESSESLVAAVTALHTAAAKSGKCKVLMPPSRSVAHHSLRSVGSLRRLVRSSQPHTCMELAFSSETDEPRAACMSVERVSVVGGCRRLVCPACVPSSYVFLHVSVQARRNASEHIHIRGVGNRTECAGTNGCAARGGLGFAGAGD